MRTAIPLIHLGASLRELVQAGTRSRKNRRRVVLARIRRGSLSRCHIVTLLQDVLDSTSSSCDGLTTSATPSSSSGSPELSSAESARS